MGAGAVCDNQWVSLQKARSLSVIVCLAATCNFLIFPIVTKPFVCFLSGPAIKYEQHNIILTILIYTIPMTLIGLKILVCVIEDHHRRTVSLLTRLAHSVMTGGWRTWCLALAHLMWQVSTAKPIGLNCKVNWFLKLSIPSVANWIRQVKFPVGLSPALSWLSP